MARWTFGGLACGTRLFPIAQKALSDQLNAKFRCENPVYVESDGKLQGFIDRHYVPPVVVKDVQELSGQSAQNVKKAGSPPFM